MLLLNSSGSKVMRIKGATDYPRVYMVAAHNEYVHLQHMGFTHRKKIPLLREGMLLVCFLLSKFHCRISLSQIEF